MENSANLDAVGGLSPSSLSMFLGCNRKYFHKKVAKTPIDSDADTDTRPFMVGKAFHKVLEDHRHELSGVGLAAVKKTCAEFEVEGDEAIMIAAMLSKYREVHEATKLKAVACEVEIITEAFHGYVDVILQGPVGWWIADMKTAASYNPAILPTLPGNLQLNLYAAHAAIIAEVGGLDLKAFRGCRYRLTTKSKLIRKATEDEKSYFARVRAAVKSFDFAIPVEILKTEQTLDTHAEAFKYIRKKRKAEHYPKNVGNCMNYNRPCEYFSQCHGFNFSEAPALETVSSV
jgi:hypothetical protein